MTLFQSSTSFCNHKTKLCVLISCLILQENISVAFLHYNRDHKNITCSLSLVATCWPRSTRQLGMLSVALIVGKLDTQFCRVFTHFVEGLANWLLAISFIEQLVTQ